MDQFKGKTVLIAGASSGIGAASARRFAAAGANLVLVARKPEPLQALAQEIDRDGSVLAAPADVTDDAAIESLLRTAVERFGGLDILVNVAALHARGRLQDVSPSDLGRMIDVNLKAPLLLTRRALPYLLQSKQASIVNVASLAGRTGVPGESTYCATKFGLRGLTFALAEELRGTSVTVSVVSPGPIETPFILDDLEHVPDLALSIRMSSAEQVAALIVKSAADGKLERVIPGRSRYLTTFAYLFPGIARWIRPSLIRKGQRVKARYRARESN